ncbi:MAG: ATP-binding cassette domain-containing protein [Thermoguttaceae bacterium]|nr:ATP-binding cassette domain-containing protein [Thermoguttaceae bacterium]
MTESREKITWEGQVYTDADGQRRVLRRRRPLLETEGLYVEFDGHEVLRDINLPIRRGETVAIIGESGCGKTVLLKTLIGLNKPSYGNIWLDGVDLTSMSSRQLSQARTRFGFVFQQAALFDSMTIWENVAFPILQNRPKTRKDEIDETVHRLLHEVGLTQDVEQRYPAELSGGMRKRVGFARALAINPELMLYDEPTTGLDPIMSDVINEMIINARDKHKVTGVIVTHDMKSAKKVADRIVMLYPLRRLGPDEPQVLFDGPPDEIDDTDDKRVWQFINGYAGERLMEMTKH